MVTLNLQSIDQPKIWDIEINELYCVDPKVDMVDSEVVMKRKLLSVVNSIYDPEVPVPSPPAPNSEGTSFMAGETNKYVAVGE
ncbi:hypothetical protein TNIN_162081 [Trichonephila inaurata madagascariensis]|uniref:Uncharacterized protein n=1 Tax=Trichonephila inaurata madagascariensis TaxID=2747483 RepID=A0A8X7CIU6_9ARAC|nr:hypothetical protein TNIN_162081 [Trichonephila inaurata madagascariensis]